jgi:hypothetical protein
MKKLSNHSNYRQHVKDIHQNASDKPKHKEKKPQTHGSSNLTATVPELDEPSVSNVRFITYMLSFSII